MNPLMALAMPGHVGAGGVAYEDFTTYTEKDPVNSITVTSNSITSVSLARNNDARVVKDYGVGYWGLGALRIEFEITVKTPRGTTPFVEYGVLGNELTGATSVSPGGGNKNAIIVVVDGATPKIKLYDELNSSYTTDSANWFTAALNTKYKLVIDKDATTLSLQVFDTVGTLLSTQSLTHQGMVAYRYAYGLQNYGGGVAGNVTSTIVENLLIVK